MLFSSRSALAGTTIDAKAPYAYGANIGWINWYANGANGAVIGKNCCSGYIYSANLGWINLGSGNPANGVSYQNNSATDFGVNVDSGGNLTGYAWGGANIGWITFEQTYGQPKVNLLNGQLSGYAWSANWGWISLNSGYGVQTDTIYDGNDLGLAYSDVDHSPGTTQGAQPLVILGEYSPAGPLATSTKGFTSTGKITDVTFYGDYYNFTLYALAPVLSGPGANEQTFLVVGSESFSGSAATGIKTIHLATPLSVSAGDLLAFAGTGPYYNVNGAVNSDATYENSTAPGSLAATPPGSSPFIVGLAGDSSAAYDYISTTPGRNYAIGVNVGLPDGPTPGQIAQNQTLISTVPEWIAGGNSTIGGLTAQNTTGETFIAPAAPSGVITLNYFTFYLKGQAGSQVTFQGEVFNWFGSLIDGAPPQGTTGDALYTSPSISYTASGGWDAETIQIPGGVPLVSGNPYVVDFTGISGTGTAVFGNTWEYLFGGLGAPTQGGDNFSGPSVEPYGAWNEPGFGFYGDLAFTAGFSDAVGALGDASRLEGPVGTGNGGAGSDSIVLPASFAGSTWTATVDAGDAGWLHPPNGSQSGANVVFTYDQNTASDANGGATRTGTITITASDGQTLSFTVTQAGSTYGPLPAPGPVTPLVSASLDSSEGLQTPSGVAVDAVGDVYFADSGSHEVYTWARPNGPVTPLVSSPTGLSAPAGLAVDAADNVYVVDSGDNTIKEWSVGSTAFATVVSRSSAPSGFTPAGVAVDGAGNVYIADSANGAIEEWSPQNGSLTTLINGFSHCQGVAVDAAGNVYVADSGASKTYQWTPGSGSTTYTALAPLSGLTPAAVAVDGGGDVYIADSGANAIYEWVAANGNLTTPVFPFSARSPLLLSTPVPVGVAVDAWDNVYFPDENENNPAENNAAIEELPYAYVDTTPKPSEPGSGGGDTLPPVLPTTANINVPGPFAPTSEAASWLRITGTANGVATFGFLPNQTGSSRQGNLTVLGATVQVMQGYESPPTFASSCYAPPMGIVNWWPGADSPNDIVGGDNGIPEGEVTYTTGNDPQGQAFSFDGTDFLATSSQVNDPQNLTLECWFKTAAAQGRGGVLIGFSQDQSDSGGAYDRLLYLDDNGYLHFGVYYEYNFKTVDAPFWCNDGNWHHVAATISSTGGASLYVDGALVANNPNATTAQDYTGWWRIGEDNIGGWPNQPALSYFDGAIDEVSIYERPLSGTEIQSIYLAGVNGKCQSAVASATITLGAGSRLEGPAGGSDSVVLAAGYPSTAWTATVPDPNDAVWLQVVSPANGNGTGSMNVIFTCQAQPMGGATRTGTIAFTRTSDGQVVTKLKVTQAGYPYVAAPGPVTPLVSSGLTTPTGVAVDGGDNVYIADSGVVNNISEPGAISEWIYPAGGVTPLPTQLATPLAGWSSLQNPQGVAVDGQGNAYIADTGNGAIEEWTPGSTTLTTLVYPFWMMGGVLSTPTGVAVDGADNVYIADTGNNAIFEWLADEQAVIMLPTQLASQLPSGASSLQDPQGVAVDAADNVYIADTGNGAVEEWTPGSGALTTLVSSAPNGGILTPAGVAVDGAGNVYISDSNNDAIYEWVAASGSLITLVSSSSAPSGFIPSGVAADGAGDVYIADTNPANPAVEELPYAFVNPTPITEPASSGSDSLPPVLPTTVNINVSGPFTPTFTDTSGGPPSWLNITGAAGGVVSFGFSANLTGSQQTGFFTVLGENIPVTQAVAGTPAGPLDHFAISAIASPQTAGTAFIITTITAQDVNNNTVTSFTGPVTFGGTAGVTGTSGPFVSGVLNDASVMPTVAGGDLTVTVTDGAGHTGSTTIATVNAGAATQLVYTSVPTTGTAGTAFSATVQSQDAYGNPASPTSSTTITLSLATGGGMLSGTLTGTIGTSANSVTIPMIIYSGSDTMTLTATATAGMTGLTPVTSGNIVFSSATYAQLQILLPPGESAAPNDPSAPTGKTGTPNPEMAGASYNVIINAVDANFNVVPGASPTLTVIPSDPSAILSQNGVSLQSGGPNGTLSLINGTAMFQMTSYTPGTQSLEARDNAITGSLRTSAPFPVNSSNLVLLVTCAGQNTLSKITPSAVSAQGTVSTYMSAQLNGVLNQPTGLAFDGAGDLLIADFGNGQVSRITPGGSVADLFLGNPYDVPGATGLAYNPSSGAIYISDGKIWRLVPPSNIPDPWAGAGTGAQGLAFNNSAGLLYASTGGNKSILEINTAGQTVRTIIALEDPMGLALDSQGNLYIANSGNNTLAELPSGSTTPTTLVPNVPGLDVPYGVAVDPSGNIFVANSGNGTISEVTSSGTTVSRFASGLGQPQWVIAAQAPTITGPGTLTYISGQPLPFAATATGYPAPNITYALQDGTPITSPWTFTGDSSYTVNCTAANIAGSAACSFTVNPPPPPVPGAAFSGLAASQTITYGEPTITLSGTVSYTGPVYPPQGQAISVTINGNTQTTTINDSTGDFSISYNSSTLSANATPYTILYSYAGDPSLSLASLTDTSTALTVNQATASITTAPTAAAITYGQALSASTLSGGSASVPGTFAFTAPATTPGASTASFGVTFTPTDAADYSTASTTVSVTVNQALLTITANNAYMVAGGPVPPLSVNYTGFVLSDGPSALNGAPLETVTPPVNSQSPAGNYTINVTMGTINNPNYRYVFDSGTLRILPQIANTTGSWTIYQNDLGYPYNYDGGIGNTVPANVTLSASWEGSPPATGYNGSVTSSVDITVGSDLSASVSDFSVGGWHSFAEAIVDYNFEVVGPAGQMVPVVLSARGATTAGDGSGFAQLYIVNTETSVEVPGSAFSAGSGNGAQGLPSTFSVNQDVEVPAGVVMQMVMTVDASSQGTAYIDPTVTVDPSFAQANQYTLASSPNSTPPPPGITITWPTPADIAYGAALTADQLNASANIDGTFSYSPLLGTVLQAGLAQPLSVTFTPSDTADYPTPATQIVPINVNPAPLTITANAASMPFGGTVPALTASYSGFVNGDTAATLNNPPNTPPMLSTTAASSSAPGEYPISVTGASDPNYNISYVNGTLIVLPPGYNSLTITATPTAATLGFVGIPGATYVVQVAATLTGPWTNLSGNLTADENGMIHYTDTTFPRPAASFYRTLYISGP